MKTRFSIPAAQLQDPGRIKRKIPWKKTVPREYQFSTEHFPSGIPSHHLRRDCRMGSTGCGICRLMGTGGIKGRIKGGIKGEKKKRRNKKEKLKEE